MNPTYQQKVIADHLQSMCGHLEKWPFRSASEIEQELCRGVISLSQGEYLVVGLADDGRRIGKVTDLCGLASFPRTSLVISYHDFERAFHEQHTEWVEL